MSEKRLSVSARRVTSVACPWGSFPTLSVSASIVHSLCHYNVYFTSERSKGIFRSLTLKRVGAAAGRGFAGM